MIGEVPEDVADTTIFNLTPYLFSHEDSSGQFTAEVQNVNVFKRIVGVLTHTYTASGFEPIMGVQVDLIKNSTGEIIEATDTDEDGFGPITYKHTGKRANYTVYLPGEDFSYTIQLKANGFAFVTLKFNDDGTIDANNLIELPGNSGGGGGSGGGGSGGGGSGGGGSGGGDDGSDTVDCSKKKNKRLPECGGSG